ncbi:MAG TPA: choice-of-anchor D domain-containing protein [Kofleriaceae bacterium]|nr:choice-of-anchor D domain-containing protein [Kofleriaceae bacterium]
MLATTAAASWAVLAAGWADGVRAAAAAPAPAAPAFHADPEVQVIDAPVNGAGSGAIELRNDTAAAIVVGSITAEPGCDAAFVHAPAAGFTVAAGGSHTLAISCTAAPASMQRCEYRARAAGGAVLLAFEAVCTYAGGADLAPDPTAVDFGAVAIGSPLSRTIAVRNAGAAALDKLFIETTDRAANFTVAAPCNPDARACDASVPATPPGATTSVVVSCTPRSEGAHAAVLHLASSAGTRAPPIALTCTGLPTMAAVLSVVPSAIDVGAVETMMGTATATVRIANPGGEALKLSDIQLLDGGAGGASDWSYTAHDPCGPAVPPSCTLGAGAFVDIDLVFDPSAIGGRGAALLVNYRDTADRTTAIPLRGIGRGATLELVGGPTVLDFGTLPLDTPASLTLTVANRGTRDLSAGMVGLTPPGPFSVAPASMFTVATAAPTPITVTCRAMAPGMFTAQLRLAATDAASPAIEVTLRCAGDAAMQLAATPPAILLGEVRLGGQVTRSIAIASSAPVTLTSAQLETKVPGMSVAGAPSSVPAMLELSVAPQAAGDLANRIVATPSVGPTRNIAIAGTAVMAMYSAPGVVSLGTFCVQQPTMPRLVELASTGTATIGVMAPALQSSDSPFDLELVAPLAFPSVLAPGQRALVAATPKRRAVAGFVTDDVVWMTDVANPASMRTKLTATFVDAGPAIAPDTLGFAPTPIHVDTRNAQQVTLQNCDVSPLQLEAPQVDVPFSVDSPPPPDMLRPGQTVTFSVGFHPTKLGAVSKTLAITSPQLRTPLMVTLTGTGIAAGGDVTGGSSMPGLAPTSFYACDSCASADASSALALAIAALAVLRRRRRARLG